jgi:DnaJ domain
LTPNRRAALEGLAKILDAAAPEELFAGGADDEAIFLYDLLVEATRARSSSYYWEICRTARRFGVSPEYVVDRAAVLLATMNERRRADLYRVLGVPPLASGDTIRQRWIDVAKRHHPDAGGDGAVFRYVKQAYEVLRDPERRADYERFWLRALGPFERVAPSEDVPLIETVRASVRSEARVASAGVGRSTTSGADEEVVRDDRAPEVPPVAPSEVREPLPGIAGALAAVVAARRALDRRVALAGGPAVGGIDALLATLRGALGPLRSEELEALGAEVARVAAELEGIRDRLATVAELKRRFGGGAAG